MVQQLGWLFLPRQFRRAAAAGAAAAALFAAMPGTAQAQTSNNPCDLVKNLPVCTSALGPLRDITSSWRTYQPALVQPIPIADYYPGDFEDNPTVGAGFCGTERYNPPPPAPRSTAETTLLGFPPPPRNISGPTTYCFLRYLATDFNPLCAGCHRVFIDYGAIPKTGPPAQGHWAGHMVIGADFTPTMPFNAHSPNVKNLCSDKFINPTPGSGCADPTGTFDSHLHSIEGDTAYYHHYPFEGRYFNGPAYLAGDGDAVPYHWVVGAYFDISPGGASASPVWYGAGYRGAGDALPDTDISYGCLCEVPPAGHTTFSRDLLLTPIAAPAQAAGAAPAGATADASAAAAERASAEGVAAAALPDTSATKGSGGAVGGLLLTAALIAAAGFRRSRWLHRTGAHRLGTSR